MIKQNDLDIKDNLDMKDNLDEHDSDKIEKNLYIIFHF